MSFLATASTLPFTQQLALTLIQGALAFGGSVIMMLVMFRYFPRIMEMLTSFLSKHEARDYKCKCTRCQFELRTKKGLKAWKKDHKFKKEDGV